MYTVPEKTLTLSDVRRLMSMSQLANMKQLESDLQLATQVAKQALPRAPDAMKILGHMAVMYVLHLAKKDAAGWSKCESSAQVCEAFMNAIQKADPSIPTPWTAPPVNGPGAAASSAAVKVKAGDKKKEKTVGFFESKSSFALFVFGRTQIEGPGRGVQKLMSMNVDHKTGVNLIRLRSLDASGNITNSSMITDQGYQVGQLVKRKADDTEGVIKTIGPQSVTLVVGGVEKLASAISFVNLEWKVVNQKPDAVKYDDWQDDLPHKSSVFFAQATKAKVSVMMYQRAIKEAKMWDHLEVYSKPRDVVATKHYKRGDLKLDLISTKVDMRRSSEAIPSSGILMGHADKEP